MRWKNHHKPLSILSIWWIMAIAKTWFHLLSADDLFAPNTHALDKKSIGTLKFDWIVSCVCVSVSSIEMEQKMSDTLYNFQKWNELLLLSCIIHLDRLKRFMSFKSISFSFNYNSQFVAIHFYFQLVSFLPSEIGAQVKVIQSIKIATAATIF